MNPHVEPDACDACHTKVPTESDIAAGNYFLARGTIVETCAPCHEEMVCRPGSEHLNHPCGIDKWNPETCSGPTALPLFDGFFTCLTCHLHTKPEGPDYKMVRIVTIEGKDVDWSGLCRDCHVNY